MRAFCCRLFVRSQYTITHAPKFSPSRTATASPKDGDVSHKDGDVSTQERVLPRTWPGRRMRTKALIPRQFSVFPAKHLKSLWAHAFCTRLPTVIGFSRQIFKIPLGACILHLIPGPCIVLVAINVNTAGNIRRLLLNGDQQIQSLMVET